jgi:hypothetical protein
MTEGNDKFLEALKQEFLSASTLNKPFAEKIRALEEAPGPLIVNPVLPVLPISKPSGSFGSQMAWLEEKVKSTYAIPKEMLVTSAPSSGRALELAAQYEQDRISGRKAGWMAIDEPEHMIEGCWDFPESGHDDRSDALAFAVADGRSKALTPGDIFDAKARVYGLTRKTGESDAEFRVRIAAVDGSSSGTKSGLISAVMGVPGVRDVNITEGGPGQVDAIVVCEPGASFDAVQDGAKEALENARPIGVSVNVQIVMDDPAMTPHEQFNCKCELVETEEQAFMKRLRSKILERYPPEKE